MNKFRRQTLLKIASLPAAISFANFASAQAWPDKALRIYLGLAPGGGADVAVRLIADGLRERLGQAVVVENVSGAGGTIASARVAAARPDGYSFEAKTISTAVIAPMVYKSLPYKAVEDFKPVGMIARAPLVAVVSNRVPAQDLQSLLALLKAEPGKHTYGSSGVGTVLHLAGELFKRAAGVDIRHVPYRGNAPALQALLAGDISMSFDTIGQVMPHIQAGRLKAVGVASNTPTRLMPNLVPMGNVVPGCAIDTWIGIYAPAATPAPVIDEMSRALNFVLQQRAVSERLSALSWETSTSTPEEFGRFWRAQIDTLGPLIKSLNIEAA
ncbi:MAG: tripartite tricarboxylate transporter substrate-binding protein [Burkholderiaceae bacterium]|nr:tripartite tricarboxylate transporter substrate-binding protein [Burkholderiaceae bacterium]